jgi:diguanylate cyclase (GGDEF)-like protein/PAS domain S-box-containing protein
MVILDVSVAAEVDRLASLHSYQILDTDPEEGFDDLVRLAATICSTPMSAVSLVDADRQWFKARLGLDVTETPRALSFCDHAMRYDDVMIVPDATLDPRFATNPLVEGDTGIRFYAGAPLVSPEGQPLGALCVIDTTPRELTADQTAALRLIGRQVSAQLALRRTVRSLTASERRFRTVFDRAPIGMILVNLAADQFGALLEVNGEFATTLGYSSSALAGKSFFDFVDTTEVSATRARFTLFASAGNEYADYRDQFHLRTKTDQLILVRVAGGWIQEELGSPARVVVQIEDITATRAAQDQLTYLATHDPLTGLLNRTQVIQGLRAVQRDATGSRPGYAAVLFIDLDRFKVVNDSLGHHCGDELLVTVARRLEEAVRAGDLVARIGGDEFVIVCKNLGQRGVVARRRTEALARRLEDALAMPVILGGAEVFVGASVGIALSRGCEQPAEDLIRDADTAMYSAKKRGSGRIELFDSGLRARSVQRQRMESGLHRALDRDELVIFYQPIIHLPSGRGVGAEALLRWNHSEQGLLGPDAFIDVAEETGLIVPIGNWLLEKACRDMAIWHTETGDKPTVAINISSRQLANGDLASNVTAALAASGLTPAALHLELTETALLDLTGAARAQLDEIRALGVELGIDDFGTGYSSLTYLKNLPVDFIKIDRSFVAGLGSSPSDTAIVASVVNLASSLALKVIAEGVETPDQAEHLLSMGCGYAQGYLYSRPQSAQQLREQHTVPFPPVTSSAPNDGPHSWTPGRQSKRFPART